MKMENLIKDFILNIKPYDKSKILLLEKILDADHPENMLLGRSKILA